MSDTSKDRTLTMSTDTMHVLVEVKDRCPAADWYTVTIYKGGDKLTLDGHQMQGLRKFLSDNKL